MTSRPSTDTADQLVRQYLARLDLALQGVGAYRRDEILADVREHIQAGRSELDPDDAISVRALLAQVGEPEAIAAEAGVTPPGSRRWDAWAPWLIIFGPVASGLGWLAGVLILWQSPTWTTRDKLIATVLPPIGLAALFFGLVTALGGRHLSLPLGVAIVLAVAGLAAHLLPPIHLMRARRQQRSAMA